MNDCPSELCSPCLLQSSGFTTGASQPVSPSMRSKTAWRAISANGNVDVSISSCASRYDTLAMSAVDDASPKVLDAEK